MSVDLIRYDLLAQEALRGVVRRVVGDAAKNGLPGDHHFFITFDTGKPGIKMSPRLHAQHPDELTIVLQHQFWDLTVTEDGFEVSLSFKGIPERLGVPFSAIKAFYDPAADFGVRFELAAGTGEETPASRKTPATDRSLAGLPSAPEPTIDAIPPPPAEIKDEGPEPPAGGEVVRLDRFRKK
jgi:uncharacterized protein